MVEMYFYVYKNPDGTIHVQNIVMGRLGQHHVHSEKSFEEWKKGIPEHLIHYMGTSCNCGLRAGDVMEYDGRVWHNPKFE
jgi:hypothetical protein